uniref:hypothetical protein n=1 Tax=Cephaleuros karstenii TaxID=1985640 RepID=UPI001EE0DCDD|nr:hypothetical protein MFR52_pgp060 [Cephaleuros karstenii]UIB39099.1 hypothetical protein [Cephaleuros karstenii]
MSRDAMKFEMSRAFINESAASGRQISINSPSALWRYSKRMVQFIFPGPSIIRFKSPIKRQEAAKTGEHLPSGSSLGEKKSLKKMKARLVSIYQLPEIAILQGSRGEKIPKNRNFYQYKEIEKPGFSFPFDSGEYLNRNDLKSIIPFSFIFQDSEKKKVSASSRAKPGGELQTNNSF